MQTRVAQFRDCGRDELNDAHYRPMSARSCALSRFVFGLPPQTISRTTLSGNQGQSRTTTRIDVNERLRNPGEAISIEMKKDARCVLSGSLQSLLAGNLAPSGQNRWIGTEKRASLRQSTLMCSRPV
jgi:hypothetical protein